MITKPMVREPRARTFSPTRKPASGRLKITAYATIARGEYRRTSAKVGGGPEVWDGSMTWSLAGVYGSVVTRATSVAPVSERRREGGSRRAHLLTARTNGISGRHSPEPSARKRTGGRAFEPKKTPRTILLRVSRSRLCPRIAAGCLEEGAWHLLPAPVCEKHGLRYLACNGRGPDSPVSRKAGVSPRLSIGETWASRPQGPRE